MASTKISVLLGPPTLFGSIISSQSHFGKGHPARLTLFGLRPDSDLFDRKCAIIDNRY